MATDIVLAVLSPVVEHTIGPIKTHICYALYCKSNLQNLKEEVDKLKTARESLQHRMDEETRNGKVIEECVRKWLLQVDGIIHKMEREPAEDEDPAKKKCFGGLCPNFKSRYQLGKKAKEELATVTTTLVEQPNFSSISYRAAPEMGVISTKGYQAMESRMPIFKDVMNALKVAGVNMVGVYGMGGIGKTTLAKEVAREATENKLFDKMVFASVTRTPDIMKIQGEIADQLGLTFDEESEWGRANRLRERLTKEKKILIVLDDLWKKVDLEAVGISLQDEQKECKMLLTSREYDVLSSGMDVREKFSISALNEEEAWDLFKTTAGGNVEDPQVQPIALKIATKCAGLPVAIVTSAKALKDKSLPEWKDALRELERPSPTNFTGVQGEVYSAIELSYKHLGSDDLKSTFLLSSRMGYNGSTENLLKYGMGAGLFSDVATVEEARNRLHSLVHKLKASSLLLDTDTSKQFSIHDVVRDVAISIAYRDCNVFVKSDAVELKWRDKDSLKKCSEIWLHCNCIGLPEDLKCPKLKVFIVNSGDPSLEISQKLFGGMQKLKVLGLSNLSFSSLHSSLHLLKNLRSLCLHQSSLGDQIAVVGELKKLEILSFVKSDIKHLPRVIGQLTKLKLLDLSDCSELEMIAPNVISSLSMLEELCMGNSFHHWDTEGKHNASLVELEHLSHLTNLDIHVPDYRVMSKDLFSRNLERYRIFVGDVWDWEGAYETSRTLKIKLKDRAYRLELGILMLLQKTEDLYILELNGVKSVICELDREGFPLLKHLHLHNSPDIQYIINMMDEVPSNILLFPMLESLFLYNLVSLEKIYHGIPRTQSFGKLQSLEVENCNKLRNLFSLSMAQGLSQLQSIKITSCLNMEEVVAEETEEFDGRNEGIDAMEFTQLHFISLQYLPRLSKFYSKEKTSCVSETQSKSLIADVRFREIILNDELLQTPTLLFENKIVFPKLEEMNLGSINTDRLWNGQLPAVSIQNLQRLVVAECENLKYIFSSSMVKSLVQLKHLTVRNCKSLEEIVVAEASTEEEIMSKMLFPKLEGIALWWLPKLKQFCTGSLIECPLLKRLRISWCSKFQTFISDFRGTNFSFSNEAGELNLEEKCSNATQPLFDEKVLFPRLAEIEILELDNLENIWHNQLAAGSFCELRSIEIEDCPKLVNVFPSILLRRFKRLETLRIESCELLEEIFELQGLIGEENEASDAFQLRDLDLEYLPKLKQIWKEDPQEIHNFRNLHSIIVSYCDALNNLFPFSIARDLPHLGKLEIEQCVSVREIVAKVEEDEAVPRFEFPQLISLRLADLLEFRSFYPGKHTLAISNLEELSLGGKGTSTTSIIRWHSKLGSDVDSRLKVLKLLNFKKNSDPIPFGFLQRLRNLETLSVRRSSFKRLFLNEGLVDEEHKLKFTNLVIDSVNDIRHLWEENHVVLPLLQNLKTLQVNFCQSLVNLAPSSASFQNLSTLEVHSCDGLLNLITSSTAKSLVQLVKLRIRYCENVTEIVAEQEDETNNEIVFSKLEYLELVALESLTSFCSGNYTFKFPSLKEMVVQNCPKMRFFSPGAVSTPKLQGVVWQRYPKNERRWQGDLNSTIRQLYTEMVGLWHLKLSSFPQLKETWLGQLPANFNSQLSFVTVDECASLSTAMPSNVLQFMHHLEYLTVKNCDSLEGVFNLESLNAEEGHPLLCAKLAKLKLIDLPRLRHIWNKDPEGILDFKNLEVLKVHNCSSLRNIFTPSMALGLVQLRKIEIRNCSMVEEIITEERAEQASIDRFIFPLLKVIILESLPNLTSIYSGSAILEIPSLEDITIDSCPHMKTFVSSILRENDHKVAFPNLKKLSVEWNEIVEVIRHDQFREEFFCKLEDLGLVHFPSDYVNFPSDFLQRFTNLENLVVNDASFEEIVQHEETNSGKKHIGVLAQLKKLKLSRLPKLVHLSNEDSQPRSVFQNLEELVVFNCGRLKILVPSSTSFQCLTTLKVSKCHGLINLMTSSTAKHFVQLRCMSITECDMVEEIVVNKEHEAENEVVFPKLSWMKLSCLPNLTSFHLGNCTFMLPSLEEVEVKECPKMETFSQGVISTPELERVITESDLKGYFWEDDLNSTIQKLLVETGNGVAQSKLPSSSKQPILACEAGQTKKDGLSVVSGGKAAEVLLVSETPDTITNLPPIVETIHETNKHVSKVVLNDEEEDSKQDQSSSISMSSETQICLQVQKVPLVTDDSGPPREKVMPASSVQKSGYVSHAIVDELGPMSTSTASFTDSIPASKTSSVDLIKEKSYSPADFVFGITKNLPGDLDATTKPITQEKATRSVVRERENSQLAITCRDFHETSNDKEDPTQRQNSLTNVDSRTHISLQFEKDTQGIAEERATPGNSIQQSNPMSPSITTWKDLAHDSHNASKDKEDPTQHRNSPTAMDTITHISQQFKKDSQAIAKSEPSQEQVRPDSSIQQSNSISPAIAVEGDATSTLAFPTKISSHSPPNFESLFASMEQLLKTSPASSSQSASYSNTQAESHKSSGMSLETYDYSMAVIKKILTKPLEEVARSYDSLSLLSALKNLKNCPLLNSQQSEIIQIYVENFDSLVTYHPFYEQQIDRTSALKLSIKDGKEGITELKTLYEDLSSKTVNLISVKEALKKKLREIEEEEDHIQEKMEVLYAQLVNGKEKLETGIYALPESERQQREAQDRANDANDHWAKIRGLLA
ncbi:unnamed protein product [Dovyalis caffra]|uniref:AAA+ ATPase domain-containing protein n=1 Tax=Dovyalis caffra TaxID=77055 RepID=A0AAV1RVT3_9ROSI|nr:unnamed protein product [Dovyalis caffra]